MYVYEHFWKSNDRPDFEYGALRARNLAEEIVIGWREQTELFGFDVKLTSHALEFYGAAIHDGKAETQYDEFARDTIAAHAESLSIEMERMEGKTHFPLGHADTMLAARALKTFSDYLESRCAEDLPEAA
jgi:hypothetical protein